MNRNPDPQIYFIRPAGQDGPIKVGHSIHVPLRLHEYNKWSPVELEAAAMLPIPDALKHNTRYGEDFASSSVCGRFERRFHLRYGAHRLHHEWFAPHPAILADIDNINAGAFDLGCLPEWRKVDNSFIRRVYKLRWFAPDPAHGARTANVPRSTLSVVET